MRDKNGVVVRKRRRKRIDDKIFRKNINLSGGFIKRTRMRKGKIMKTLFKTNFKGTSAILKRIKEITVKAMGKK